MKQYISRIIAALIMVMSLSTFAVAAPAAPAASDEYIKGEVLDVRAVDAQTQKQFFSGQGEMVTVRLKSGPEAGKIVDIFNFVSGKSVFEIKVNPGDKIIVAVSHDLGKTSYYISDFDRLNYVYLLLGVFAFCLILFGRMIGLKSLIVIAVSICLIYLLFIKQVLTNQINIAFLTLGLSAVIAVITHVPISGWSRKSLAAIGGTVGGVVVAAILSYTAIQLMHLTGLDSEEAMMLKASVLKSVDFQGILFSGMVLGSLGAVMDVTISIASALQEIKQIQPDITAKELFLTGMNVGKDIMGTMSNTLILAYVGSSLPLMLLIAAQPDMSMVKVMNLNLIVTEIARALTGSIGLVCAIPLTALVSTLLYHK
ncbi:YibE/F family protein [Acetonema longum]|uniref:YibE/F family protein n=1 Tax=Acetonema longum DSM 6540 TaxID=1009370 RepID=F7NNH8_9FIRM|nr:YibE/F family protein [Acetonema longum]EGO62419.1 YibE/F family protein [Acetonema longum DSM 6540]